MSDLTVYLWFVTVVGACMLVWVSALTVVAKVLF